MTPAVFWIYGLSGAGKTSLAQSVRGRLEAHHVRCLVLDGDELRAGVNSNLGYSPAGRMENVRRAAEMARLACQQGLPVIAAFMTPEHGMRDLARRIVQPFPFYEIYLDCDYETCRQRDAKGLYARAAENELHHFCGNDLEFQVPVAPDLVVDTRTLDLGEAAEQVLQFVEMRLARQGDGLRPPR